MRTMKYFFYFCVIIFISAGCASVRHAVPLELSDQVSIYGMRDIRAMSGKPNESFKNDFIRIMEQEEIRTPSFFDFTSPKSYSMLAISGGAANGAYGAGLLSGWSKEGSRPVFTIVTGISVGAIIAPFAFLGPAYDDQLKEFCTQITTKHVLSVRLSHNSLASSKPLERMIEKYFNKAFLKEVAAEYEKGRRFYVGTADLDAQRLVIWDMGKIASYGDDNALKLFHQIVLASASIPVAFPPVYLNVEVGGKNYDEMHVDGGVVKQVFFLFDILQGMDKAVKKKGIDSSKIKYKIYVIRNGYVDPVWKEVPDRLPAIAERTVDTMTNAQTVGDIYQLYVFSKMRKGDFNLAYIPGTHLSKAKEFFDPIEMKKLFDLGFEEASRGYPWRKSPPGMEE